MERADHKIRRKITGPKEWRVKCNNVENIIIINYLNKSTLTLRASLGWTFGGTAGAELVDHSSDVLHPPVHYSLHILHVKEVDSLQSTLQSWDLVPGIAQAGWHPIQLHLRKARASVKEIIFGTHYKAGRLPKSPASFIVSPANLNFRMETKSALR